MKLQILVTTMYAADFSKVEAMDLRDVDVVIANQTDRCAYEEKDFPERNVHAVMVSTNTRGAGLNRNIALSYAAGDILLFADDDMFFPKGSTAEIIKEFSDHPQADVIKFYCEGLDSAHPLSFKRPASFQKAKLRTLMSAGAPAVAVRREKLEKHDILFPTGIGPGRYYYCGEDSVFLKRMIQSKMQVYLSPVLAAYVNNAAEDSTWFNGYDAHYFETVGYVYAKLYGRLAPLVALRRALKSAKEPEISYSRKEMYGMMARGIQNYRT